MIDVNKVLSTVGLITGVLGALFIALNADMFILGYSLFLVSSISWVTYAIRTNQMNLCALNSVFGIINAVGLWNFSV